tara:strand:+ start:436 stop:831 length:396 start_codon:yes stop_codon:yes gene_type:complete
LKNTNNTATVIPKSKGALIIERKLTPDALIALISLSSDNLPKVISVARSTAIGTDNAIIQARFKNKYSNIVMTSKPLPRKRSIALSKKLMKRRKVIINSEKKNGRSISLMKYLERRLIPKITIILINFLIY